MGENWQREKKTKGDVWEKTDDRNNKGDKKEQEKREGRKDAEEKKLKERIDRLYSRRTWREKSRLLQKGMQIREN